MPTSSIKYVDSYNATKKFYSELNAKYKEKLIYFDPIDKAV